jgi:hypothetical protein
LLANVYLHYVFDLWAQRWRQRYAHGDVVIVRFADDFIVGFEQRADAQRFLGDLRERLAKFALELHAEKTRLIEFGRFAAERRAARGLGRPETFEFLGFTHICGTDRNGRFQLKRITAAQRMRATLAEVKARLKRRQHRSVAEQGRWLASVVRGHFAYYAVPGNSRRIRVFRDQVTRHWHRALLRRSQRHRLTWQRMYSLQARWLPPAVSCIPIRTRASSLVPEAGAQCGSSARWDLCGGPPARAVPTAITTLQVASSTYYAAKRRLPLGAGAP